VVEVVAVDARNVDDNLCTTDRAFYFESNLKLVRTSLNGQTPASLEVGESGVYWTSPTTD
jgi:hypothetical protein